MQRGVFAKTQAGIRGHLLGVDQPRLFRCGEAGDAGDVNGRLADVRLVEPFVRPVEAQVGQIKAEHGTCLIINRPGDGELLGDVIAHADVLGTLAGTENVSSNAHFCFFNFPVRSG